MPQFGFGDFLKQFIQQFATQAPQDMGDAAYAQLALRRESRTGLQERREMRLLG